MYRALPLLAVFCLSIFAEQPEAILRNAIAAHQAGDLQSAVHGYKEFLKLRPDSAQVYSNLGAVLARQGQYEDAISEYNKALKLDPSNPGISLNLAIAYYKTADLARAVRELEGLRALQPDNNQVTLLLADCWLQLGENEKIIRLLTPLDNDKQQDLGLAYMLGTALLRDKQFTRGQQLLDRILRNGDSAEARLMLGTAKLAASDFAGALPDLAKAVELNKKLPSVNAYYGQALMATGDTPAAAKAFRQELLVNANDFESNLNLAALLKQDQNYDEALKYLDRAIHVRPNDLRTKYQLATIHLAQGKVEDSRKELEEVVRGAPKFTEAHVSLATVYYRLKRKSEGDHERTLVLQLNAEAQATQPGSQPR